VLLLCSDLDRTLLPNGNEPESPAARPLLRGFAARPDVSLAYVTGRHKALLEQAIEEFSIPVPDFAIGDVGSTIYEIIEGCWQPWDEWAREIARDWRGLTQADLCAIFDDLPELRLQEAERQSAYKLSYFTFVDVDLEKLRLEMHRRLQAEGIEASLVWSIDEQAETGLLDVLPRRATKIGAIRFLIQHKGFSEQRTVFAGDSGNDLPALVSGLQAVLVRNAHHDVVLEAKKIMHETGRSERLYLAQGEWLGLNGNYAAGVLEGVAHFIPETGQWFRDSLAALPDTSR